MKPGKVARQIVSFRYIGMRFGRQKRDGGHFASLVAQRVKRLPAMQETWVPSLGQEDPLEKGMATHSSILAWEIPWTEEPGGLHSMGSQRVSYGCMTKTHTQDYHPLHLAFTHGFFFFFFIAFI